MRLFSTRKIHPHKRTSPNKQSNVSYLEPSSNFFPADNNRQGGQKLNENLKKKKLYEANERELRVI